MSSSIGLRRSNSEKYGKPAYSTTLESSRSGSFPDLAASDVSTTGSIGDSISAMAQASPQLQKMKAGSSKMRQTLQTTSMGNSAPMEGSTQPDTPEPSISLHRPHSPKISPSASARSSKSKLGESTNTCHSSSTDIHKNTAESESSLLIESFSSPLLPMPSGLGDCQARLQRASSVPHRSSLESDPSTETNKPLSRMIQEHQELRDTTHSHAEDSTLEGSWRPNPDKRRILSETMAASSNGMVSPMMSSVDESLLTNKSSLDNFLDSLIFDSKKKRDSPGVNFRKWVEHRRTLSSSQSVGGSLDHYRPTSQSLFDKGSHPSKHQSLPQPPFSRRSSHSASPRRGRESHSVASRGSRESRSSRGSRSTRSPRENQEMEGGPPQPSKSAPIAWSRKESNMARRQHQPTRSHSMIDSDHSTRHQDYQDYQRSPTRVLEDSNSIGILSAFMNRESKHERPTSAHTISGEPRAAADAVSIAIWDSSGSKAFSVGPKEAKIIQKLLENSNDIQSPKEMSTSSWLQAAAEQLKSPSAHDTIITSASTIAESDRVSTRSSLQVELSPPLQYGKGDMMSFLDKRRGRDRRSSAFTVAGDCISVRFQGKSTSELVDLIQQEQEEDRMESIREGTFADMKGVAGVGGTRKLRPAKSGARHPRDDLGRLVMAPNLENLNAMHDSMPTNCFRELGASGQGMFSDPNDDPFQVDSIRENAGPSSMKILSTATYEDLQFYLDGRSPTSRRKKGGAHSVSGGRTANSKPMSDQRPRRSRSNAGNQGPSRNQSPRSGHQRLSTNKDLELEEFRPPSAGRPTNRRTMIRKMHSVPVLSVDPMPAQPRRRPRSLSKSRRGAWDKGDSVVRPASPDKMPRSVSKVGRRRSCSGDRKSPSRSQSLRRSESIRKGKKKPLSDTSFDDMSTASKQSSSRKGKTKLSNSKKQGEVGEEDLELEDLHKSFLDQFLDGAVDRNDPVTQRKEDYRANTTEARVENSTRKLRVEPEFLESSQRLILQDPSKSDRRSEFKRVKSASSIEEHSPALMELYDAAPQLLSPKKVSKEATKANSAALKTPKTLKKSGGKKTGKKKKGSATQKKKSRKGKSMSESAEGKASTDTGSGAGQGEDEDLPESGAESSDRLMLVERTCGESEMSRKPTSERITKNEKVARKKTPTMRGDSSNTAAHSQKPKSLRSKTPKSGKSDTAHEAGRLVARIAPGATPESSRDDSGRSGWTKAGIGRLPLSVEHEPPSMKSPSRHANEEQPEPEFHNPPSKPVRRLSRTPDQRRQESHPHDQMRPQEDLPKKAPQQNNRLPPVNIPEGSILEVNDEMSVCSDITDGFSFEPMEPEYIKKGRRKDLGRIDEAIPSEHGRDTVGGSSWAKLSVSDPSGRSGSRDDNASQSSALSHDRHSHLSKRWQSTPNMSSSVDMLKSPRRGIDLGKHGSLLDGKEPMTPGRFGWLKKKLAFKKKVSKSSKPGV